MLRIWTRTTNLVRARGWRVNRAPAVPARGGGLAAAAPAALRDADMQRALAGFLRARAESEGYPNPERDREQLRRLVRWAECKLSGVGEFRPSAVAQ